MRAKLSNAELLVEVRRKSKHEQNLTLEVIDLIREVNQRRLYLELGFSSLFDFVTKDLGFEPASAMRRIQAARVIADIPEVKSKIEDGRLSLSVISQVQSFFRKEENIKREKLSKVQKLEILSLVENKSSREAEKELIKLNPETVKKTESQRELTANLTELKLVVDHELKLQLDELKFLLSHQNPNLSYVELIRLMALKIRKSLNPRPQSQSQSQSQTKPKPTPTSEAATRNIPAQVKRWVWQRDKACCQYKDLKSGQTCQSKFQLQIDHIQRFRDGGGHGIDNLRLLCRAHNNWRG